MGWYLTLIAAVAVERLAELVVSKRNLAWSLARGGTDNVTVLVVAIRDAQTNGLTGLDGAAR